MEKTVYIRLWRIIPLLAIPLLLAACQKEKPAPEPPVECSEDWTVSIAPTTRFHTGPFSAEVSSTAPAGTLLEYATANSEGATLTWRPVQTEIPVQAEKGELLLAVRYACDPVDKIRAQMTYVFPDGDAALFVSPESGAYREAVTVTIEGFPADLTWDVSMYSAEGTLIAAPENHITVPDDGSTYRIAVQGWDAYGHKMPLVEKTYSSDPYSPAIISLEPPPGPIGPSQVFVVTFDKPVDIENSLHSSEFLVVQYLSEFEARVFPRSAWPTGPLSISEDDFGFKGPHNSRLIPGDVVFPIEYDICRCEQLPNAILGLDMFATVPLAAFPTKVTLASILPLAQQSLQGRLVSLLDGTTTYFDSADFNSIDAQQTQLTLEGAPLREGGIYALQITANGTHPLSSATSTYLQFSVAATGYQEVLTEVTAAGEFHLYNNPIDFALVITDAADYSLEPGPNPFTLQFLAGTVTGSMFDVTDTAGNTYSSTGTSADNGLVFPDLVTEVTIFPDDTTVVVENWGQAQWSLRTPKPVTFVTRSHLSVTFGTGDTFYALDLYPRNTHEAIFAVRDFLDLYSAQSARVALLFTIWYEDGTWEKVAHRVDLIQGSQALRTRIDKDSLSASFFSTSATQASLQSLALSVHGLPAAGTVTAVLDTMGQQVTALTSGNNVRFSLAEALTTSAVDSVADISLFARDATGDLLDSHTVRVPVASAIGFAASSTVYADSATQDSITVHLTGNPVTTAGSSLTISRLYNSDGLQVQNWFWPATVDRIPLHTRLLPAGTYSLHIDMVSGSDPSYARTGYSSANINLQID